MFWNYDSWLIFVGVNELNVDIVGEMFMFMVYYQMFINVVCVMGGNNSICWFVIQGLSIDIDLIDLLMNMLFIDLVFGCLIVEVYYYLFY